MNQHMHRRKLLASLGLLPMLQSLPVLAQDIRAAIPSSGTCLEAILDQLGEQDDVTAIASVWLQQNSSDPLVNALNSFLEESLWRADCSGDEALQRVQESIRADFAAERTFSVGGWILSRTEVLLCWLVLLRRVA